MRLPSHVTRKPLASAGSADLEPSTKTYLHSYGDFSADNRQTGDFAAVVEHVVEETQEGLEETSNGK